MNKRYRCKVFESTLSHNAFDEGFQGKARLNLERLFSIRSGTQFKLRCELIIETLRER
jgi:hypothetical protein